MDTLILSIGVVVGSACIYAVWAVIRTRKWRRSIPDETRLDALRKIDQAR